MWPEKIAWSQCLIQFHVCMFEIARVMLVLMAAFRSGVAVAEAMTFSHDRWLLYCGWYFIDTCISTSVCNAPVCIFFVLWGCILYWKHSIVASSPKYARLVCFSLQNGTSKVTKHCAWHKTCDLYFTDLSFFIFYHALFSLLIFFSFLIFSFLFFCFLGFNLSVSDLSFSLRFFFSDLFFFVLFLTF